MPRLDALLREARAALEPGDAEPLLAHALGRTPAWLYAHGDDEADALAVTRFEDLLARRRAGEPVAYLLGRRGFWRFDLRVGHVPAGLEAAHIQWHTAGGPDIEPNGLSLCALHHKLFDLGAFTLDPASLKVLFSEHALAGTRGMTGELRHHGQDLLPPVDPGYLPAPEFLDWNWCNVFKREARRLA